MSRLIRLLRCDIKPDEAAMLANLKSLASTDLLNVTFKAADNTNLQLGPEAAACLWNYLIEASADAARGCKLVPVESPEAEPAEPVSSEEIPCSQENPCVSEARVAESAP